MAQYEKLNFVNGYPPALNAATLNHMDDGIATANEGVTALEETIANNKKETDTAFATKADKTDVYSINEADEMFLTRAEARSEYTPKSYSEALNNTKANKTEVYTKTESDSLLSDKPDKDSIYTKAEVEASLKDKAYRAEVNAALEDKADKTEVDNLNSTKANINDVYTKTETDSKLSGKLNNSEGSVQRDNIEIGAVGSDEIADFSILPYHLSNGAVTTEKIADGQITVDKLSDDIYSANNLIQIQGSGIYEKNGITVTYDEDNYICISGTSTAYVSVGIPVIPYKITANKDYIFSTQPDRNNKPDSAISTTNPTVSLIKDSTVITSTTVKGSWEDNSKSINSNVDTEVNKIHIAIATGNQVNINFHIQLEEGTKYTKYTSPTDKSLAIPLGNNSVKTDSIENNAVTFDKLSDDVKHSINNDYKMNYLYVDLNYIETDDGFGITKFNSIIEANNSIKDNSKTNRYTILIYPGTYTELQNLYSGTTDTANLQGIQTKDYVYYEGTQPYNPQSTCIEWDGDFGYDEGALTSEMAVKKCIFHLTSGLNGMHTHIKNLHLKSKNTRYGLHIETGGYGRNVEWLFSNCIVEFGGRPDISGDRNAPCCGMGVSPYEKGEFSNCQFVFTDKEGITPDLVILNCHNNAETTVYTEVRPIKEGSRIIFNSCDFNGYSVKFATTYEQNGTKNIAEFNGCSNYSNITTLPSATYGDNWDVIDSMKDLNYELTDSDKLEIANLVLSQIPTTNGVEY